MVAGMDGKRRGDGRLCDFVSGGRASYGDRWAFQSSDYKQQRSSSNCPVGDRSI